MLTLVGEVFPTHGVVWEWFTQSLVPQPDFVTDQHILDG